MLQTKSGNGIAFLVNGGRQSAMAIRARSFAQVLGRCDIEISYRDAGRIGAVLEFCKRLFKQKPHTVYVFDMAVSGVFAALSYGIFRKARIIIDTGDAIGFLADSIRDRSWLGRKLTHLLEQVSISSADALVVRSQNHYELLRGKARTIYFIPDGVDTNQFRPLDASRLRKELGISMQSTVVGLLGSIVWNHQWEMCYGWDLVEALSKLRDLPVKAVIIGDGNGLVRLKQMARQFEVDDRILFLGRIAYEELPRYLSLFDICLSTQTNDLAGQVRTSGKLPLYLACGKHVLATEVGEAARILPASMLLRYDGTKDGEYPARLARRIRDLIETRDWRNTGLVSRSMAREQFDYTVLEPTFRMALNCAN